ncbi:MAG: GAF domain-containing protein [Anaerolineales bacterium]|nr:GAF domain-containing protein [Anaerolineales bacterium]
MASPWTSSVFRGQRESGLTPRARGGLARLLLAIFLPLLLLPLAVFTLLVYAQARGSLTDAVTTQLNTLATLKVNQIEQWADARVGEVNALAHTRENVFDIQRFLNGGSNVLLLERYHEFLNANPSFEAVMLADAETGTVLVATLPFQYDQFVGLKVLDDDQLAMAQLSASLFPPVFNERVNDVQIVAAAPVLDAQGRLLAVLYGFVRDEQLLDIVAPSPGLSTRGRAYVVTRDGYQLGSFITAPGAVPDTLGVERARMDQQNGMATYPNQTGEQVIGVYRWLPSYELALLVEESTQAAFGPLNRFVAALIAIAISVVAVSALGVVFFTGRITSPLRALTEVAMRMAGGDLSSSVKINRNDEIGLLAEAFNGMSSELRGLYQDLERKVEARTQQLAAAAEVGRAATSILSTDELLRRTVDLIRDRFGYYHVSVFLLDEAGQTAVLQEATGEIGAQLKARGHHLGVGSPSLIGWVTANRKPRIALDVGEDAVYFQNDLLPDTRSEAALPLRVGDRLIGALDVQSRALNAFNQADIEVLQVLADQLATAIENGRLFARQERLAQLEQHVATLTARIHSALTLEAILNNTASEVGQVFGAPRVVVRLAPEAEPSAAAVGSTTTAKSGGNGANGHDQH